MHVGLPARSTVRNDPCYIPTKRRALATSPFSIVSTIVNFYARSGVSPFFSIFPPCPDGSPSSFVSLLHFPAFIVVNSIYVPLFIPSLTSWWQLHTPLTWLDSMLCQRTNHRSHHPYTGLSKKMDGIWNRYNLKSTGRIYTFCVLKCSEKYKVLDLP